MKSRKVFIMLELETNISLQILRDKGIYVLKMFDEKAVPIKILQVQVNVAKKDKK